MKITTSASIIITFVTAVLLILAIKASAGQTATVPNTFVSGQVATAASVNDNFSTLATGINANTLTMFRSDDTIVGTVLNISSTFNIISDKYYAFWMKPDSQISGGVFYASNDCTGTPYLHRNQSVVRIVNATSDSEYYYSPKQGNYLAFIPQSYQAEYTVGCQVGAQMDSVYYEALPNDVAVTGVVSEPIGLGFYFGGRQ
jgi:hypothetical protein